MKFELSIWDIAAIFAKSDLSLLNVIGSPLQCLQGWTHPLNFWSIDCVNEMAEFRPNSEIIGKIRKMEKFYGHFVKLQK